MKALTLWQPWATLAAMGVKEYETRHWPTNYRGQLAIHAARRPVTPDDLMLRGIVPSLENLGIYRVEDLPMGAVLGIVQIDDVVRADSLTTPAFINSMEYHLGNYEPGRFAWRLRVLKGFDTPIPCPGRQGLWEWDERMAAA